MYNLMHDHSSDSKPTILESFSTYLEARKALLDQVEYFTATLGTMQNTSNNYYTWHSSDQSWAVAVYLETVDGLAVDSHGSAISLYDLSQEALDYDENEVGPYSPNSFYGQTLQLDRNILISEITNKQRVTLAQIDAIRQFAVMQMNEVQQSYWSTWLSPDKHEVYLQWQKFIKVLAILSDNVYYHDIPCYVADLPTMPVLTGQNDRLI